MKEKDRRSMTPEEREKDYQERLRPEFLAVRHRGVMRSASYENPKKVWWKRIIDWWNFHWNFYFSGPKDLGD